MIKGIKQGLGIFIGLFLSAIFAYSVSGTIKTWTTGETLTASDLNTTVQSLKTAVEGATQYFEVRTQAQQGNTTYNTFAGTSTNGATEVRSTILRSGTIKSASLLITGNSSAGACTITLQKNGVDTAISFFVPAGSTTTVTDADTVAVAANDQLCWKMICGSTSALNFITAVMAFEF